MTDKGGAATFLSCFKCGRIVRSSDEECPRCGMKFGPGTLFECPFCAGLVWRSAERCTTCKTDLVEFSKEIGGSLESFSMDGFVDEMLEVEMDNIKHGALRVACPSCGLMIRGDEERCPRCGMLLKGVKVDCPVCGEKVVLIDEKCKNCGTVFYELSENEEAKARRDSRMIREQMSTGPDEDLQKIRAILATAKESQERTAAEKEEESQKSKEKKKKKLGLKRR